MSAAATAYQRSSVDTSGPVKLIVMLHGRLLTALDRTEAARRSDDTTTTHDELTRAQAIVMELWSSLDPEAGDVATNLASLYEYSHRRLVAANVEKDFTPAQPVRVIFTELREAWMLVAPGTA